MAHPTIDIKQSPDVDCLHPAYNCVTYCFKCNDFLISIGTMAQFTLEGEPTIAGYLPGVVFVVAGQTFNSGSQNTYNQVNTAPIQTPLEITTNFKAAFEANNYLFNNFTFQIVGGKLIATARNDGELPNFIFDYTATPIPPLNSDTQGSFDVYRDNYRLAVEIWDCYSNSMMNKISSESYIPDQQGNFCLNIGGKIAALLQTTFVHKTAINVNSNWFYDYTISRRVCVRYGEIYSDDIEECGTEPRTFETAPSIVVVNSAFQRNEQQDKYLQLCATEFMTSMPDHTLMCENSLIFLWINLIDVFESLQPNQVAYPYYEVNYYDGTIDSGIGSQFIQSGLIDPGNNDFVAMGAGIPTIGSMVDPNKQIMFWKAQIVIRTDGNPDLDTFFGCKYFKMTNCCEGQVEFYFLNEFGGIDTILFQQVQQIELSNSFSVVEQYTDCASNDALESGANIINQSAFDVYTITSKFTNDYETRLWLRQFIASPQKWVRANIIGNDDVFSKVIALDTSTVYYNESDSSLLLTLQWRFNEDLNLQKN